MSLTQDKIYNKAYLPSFYTLCLLTASWLSWDAARCIVSNLQAEDDVSIPVQTLTGPKASRSLRLPDFQTIGTCGCQPYAPPFVKDVHIPTVHRDRRHVTNYISVQCTEASTEGLTKIFTSGVKIQFVCNEGWVSEVWGKSSRCLFRLHAHNTRCGQTARGFEQ